MKSPKKVLSLCINETDELSHAHSHAHTLITCSQVWIVFLSGPFVLQFLMFYAMFYSFIHSFIKNQSALSILLKIEYVEYTLVIVYLILNSNTCIFLLIILEKST